MPGLMILVRAELHASRVDVEAVGDVWALFRRLVFGHYTLTGAAAQPPAAAALSR